MESARGEVVCEAGPMAELMLTRVGGAIGAVIDGVGLTEETDDAIWDAIREALAAHHVLFFRDQPMSGEQQIEVASRFGTPSTYPMQALSGSTEPSLSEIIDTEDSPPTTDGWHTDVTWVETPPVAAILTALEVPAYGGDTMWASTAAAYDALSDTMRSMIDGLEVRHSNWPEFCEISERKSGVEGLGERIRAAYPDVVHPLVRTHPENGRRSLYLSGSNTMKQVVGMEQAESDALLDFLRSHMDQPKFHCRWSWSPHDVAIWDERTTNHRGLSDHYPLRRVVRRCTADGERPYFAA